MTSLISIIKEYCCESDTSLEITLTVPLNSIIIIIIIIQAYIGFCSSSGTVCAGRVICRVNFKL